MIIEPLAGALGAEIRGIDLKHAGEREYHAVHEAFLKYSVLVFRDRPCRGSGPRG